MITEALILMIVYLTAFTEGIEKPPSFIKPTAKETRYIKSRETISIHCNAEGTPTPLKTWTFNGNKLASTSIYDIQNGTLTIKGFSSREAGHYQCFAENTVNGNKAVAMSPVIVLVEVLLESTWETEPVSERINEGEYLKLTCDKQPRCVPRPLYTWHLVEDSATGTNDGNEGEVKETDRIYIDNEGTLHFTYLKTDDSSKTLTYKCGIRNSILDLIKLGNMKKIQVDIHADGLPTVGAKNKFQTSPAIFLRSTTAELECVFSGHPIPTITWKDKVKNVITRKATKYEITSNGRKLLIKDLEESDEGLYYCEGRNAKGTDEVSIFLDVKSGPLWVKSLSSQTLPEGSDAMFFCKARPAQQEDPLNEPVWYKNGVQMKKDLSGKLEFSDQFRVLTVKNLKKTTDIMCLQCNVSNSIGYEFGDACLNVIEPIFVSTKPKLRQIVTKGTKIHLTVLGTTDPALTLKYRWKFKNISYDGDQTPPHVTFNKTTNETYIDTSALSDGDLNSITGTYYRELYHQYETKTVAIEVLLEGVAGAGIGPGQDTDVILIIVIVVVIVLLVLIVILIVCCIRYKADQGRYRLESKEIQSGLNPLEDLEAHRFQDVSGIPLDENDAFPKSAIVNPNFDHRDEDLPDDADESMAAYDMDTSKFNEDGSFIGQYKRNPSDIKTVPTNRYGSESEI